MLQVQDQATGMRPDRGSITLSHMADDRETNFFCQADNEWMNKKQS